MFLCSVKIILLRKITPSRKKDGDVWGDSVGLPVSTVGHYSELSLAGPVPSDFSRSLMLSSI